MKYFVAWFNFPRRVGSFIVQRKCGGKYALKYLTLNQMKRSVIIVLDHEVQQQIPTPHKRVNFPGRVCGSGYAGVSALQSAEVL